MVTIEQSLASHDNATLSLSAEKGGKILASEGSRARRRVMDEDLNCRLSRRPNWHQLLRHLPNDSSG
jgi:hypothetical protein